MTGQHDVAIITDSTADISPEMVAERGITVVPLTVAFGAETFDDGIFTQQEFFARMAQEPELPTTTQPSPGRFAEVYEQALETASSVVSIHISNKLSGTLESARQAAAQFEGRVRVFDSLNLSWGLAMQVTEAVRAAEEGVGPEGILEMVAGVRDRVRMIVGLDSLDNLARGGRIGRVSAFMGAMLNLKVTLTVDPNGEFQPVARSRGERPALDHTLDWIADKLGSTASARFAVGYAAEPDRAERLAAAIHERFNVDELVIYAAGSVICAHTGPGWGVTVLPSE